MRTISLAILVVALVLTSGCEREKTSSPEPSTAASTQPTRCGDGPAPSDAERASAMLSVHAYAYDAAGRLPHEVSLQDLLNLGLPKLEKAVDILLADCGPQAGMRKRRAAAKLAAWGGENTATVNAWKQLVHDPGVTATILAGVHQPPLRRESLFFDGLTSLSTGCKSASDPAFDGPVLENGLTAWSVSFSTDANQDWLRPRLDPQNWDTCSPQFFTKAYYTTAVPARETSCTKGPPADPPENDARTPGSTGYDTTLFEHFVGAGAEAVNLLKIHTRGSPGCAQSPFPCGTPVHQVCYELPCSPKVGCGDPPTGFPDCCGDALYFCRGSSHEDMTRDHGDLSICTPTTGTGLRVVVRKKLKFGSWSTNPGVWVLYSLSQKETTEATIDLAACCQLP